MTYESTTRTGSLPARLGNFVRESLRENRTDFTSGPIGRGLGLLAIPMMLEMAMEAVFALADIVFVSLLGTNAVAAVGLTEALVTVLYALAIGFGMGVTAMVSRRIGARRFDDAATVAGQAIWVGLGLALAIATVGLLWAEDLLELMGASDAVIAEGAGYTLVLLGGSGSIIFLFLLNAAFRGAGDAPIALRALVLANGINIVLDPLLIFGLGPFPELGVTGAAVATTIGRGTGVAYLAWTLFNGRGRLRLTLSSCRLVPSLVRRMVAISIGGVGQFLIATASWIAIMRIVALYGSAPVAAYTIALRLIEFALLPAWGLGNAAATLVGQNLGAGKPDRAEQTVWRAARYNATFMLGVGIVLVLAAAPIVALFSDDADILRHGTACLRILGIGYPLYAVGMIIIQAMNGAGDTRTPSVMNFVCFWLLQIPLAWTLAQAAGLGPSGVFWSIVISESMLTVLGVLVFRRGRWRSMTV
ncbi:MAG TPA: MATE family efflux transporter [Woeseiaceae bacterium]|nr:MATE family efflux transporter [Woeseiaceae bacterium]